VQGLYPRSARLSPLIPSVQGLEEDARPTPRQRLFRPSDRHQHPPQVPQQPDPAQIRQLFGLHLPLQPPRGRGIVQLLRIRHRKHRLLQAEEEVHPDPADSVRLQGHSRAQEQRHLGRHQGGEGERGEPPREAGRPPVRQRTLHRGQFGGRGERLQQEETPEDVFVPVLPRELCGVQCGEFQCGFESRPHGQPAGQHNRGGQRRLHQEQQQRRHRRGELQRRAEKSASDSGQQPPLLPRLQPRPALGRPLQQHGPQNAKVSVGIKSPECCVIVDSLQDFDLHHQGNDRHRTRLRQVLGLHHRQLHPRADEGGHPPSPARPEEHHLRQRGEDIRVSQPTLPSRVGRMREQPPPSWPDLPQARQEVLLVRPLQQEQAQIGLAHVRVRYFVLQGLYQIDFSVVRGFCDLSRVLSPLRRPTVLLPCS
jgi:hypothetical protein